MWLAKFRLTHKGDVFTDLTKKQNIEFYAYPITHYLKSKKVFFVVAGILYGEDEPKKKFIVDLKKDKRLVKLEVKNDFLTVLINYPDNEIVRDDLKTYYDPAIIHTEPVYNSKDGWEYWSVASFEKDKLMSLINSSIKHHSGKLISINEKKVSNLSIINITPKISKMQKSAIEIAFSEGYYEYPRKVEIRDLAKIMKISYSTCQEHLRRAEIALLPTIIKKI